MLGSSGVFAKLNENFSAMITFAEGRKTQLSPHFD
jgi:hypothetical protein